VTPSFHGYVDVGALELYCERHGNGHPLVLLHGAFGTIESCFADLLPGTSHEGMLNRVEWLSSMITRFLTSPKQ